MPSGTIPLQGTKLKTKERGDGDDQSQWEFSLIRGQKSYYVAGRTQQDYEDWVEIISASTKSRAVE